MTKKQRSGLCLIIFSVTYFLYFFILTLVYKYVTEQQTPYILASAFEYVFYFISFVGMSMFLKDEKEKDE